MCYYDDKLYPNLIHYDDVSINNLKIPSFYKSIIHVWRSFDKKECSNL